MADAELTESLLVAERRLQAAQLASDLPSLAELLGDTLLFTGADGRLFSKMDDLDAHRSGYQVLHRLEEQDLRLRVVGSTGITWFLGILEGSVNGEPFAAQMRYTRTWANDEQTGWKLIAAHASMVRD